MSKLVSSEAMTAIRLLVLFAMALIIGGMLVPVVLPIETVENAIHAMFEAKP